jgi:hypothetical protein
MPETLPLNRVMVGVDGSRNIGGQTNAQGWYFPHPVPAGQYNVSITLAQQQGGDAYHDTQDTVVQRGQVTFVRFAVPIGQVSPTHVLDSP